MTLKEFKQELIEYGRSLIPEALKPWVRIPGLSTSGSLYLINGKSEAVIAFVQSVFEQQTTTFQLARNDYYGCEVLESFQFDENLLDQEITSLLDHQSIAVFTAEEQRRLKKNINIGLNHRESSVSQLLEKAREAKLITFKMSTEKEQIRQHFLATWPVDRVKEMTLGEYTNLNREDSFCYWLESVTQRLGSIWGGSSYKFGIYERNNLNKQDTRKGYKTDGVYGWVRKYGETRDEAFGNVKAEIIKVVEAATQDRLREVDSANLGQAYKWKIAALYHQNIPLIYKPFAINYLVTQLKGSARSFSDKYRFLSDQRSEGESVIELSERLWQLFVHRDDPPEEPEDQHTTPVDFPLNQIFFGPPGTGKTYHTISEAVKIVEGLDDVAFEDKYYDRETLRDQYKKYVDAKRITFTTFHQSMSYEDFVEGIKPDLSETEDGEGGTIKYHVRDGLFKEICHHAENYTAPDEEADERIHKSIREVDFTNRRFWKMSLGDTSLAEDQAIYDFCIKNGCIALGKGWEVDYADCDNYKQIAAKLSAHGVQDNDASFINYFKHDMKEGDIVVVSNGNYRFRAVGMVKGPYEYGHDIEIAYKHLRPVEWLLTDFNFGYEELYASRFTMRSLYKMVSHKVKRDFFEQFKEQAPDKMRLEARNYVIIIDEINRGNVSQIFGELITLLEPDKRAGRPEGLSVTLPYSQQTFNVPDNVYLICTMNTADRSVEALDTALRRRFQFVERQPDFSLLSPFRAVLDIWKARRERVMKEEAYQQQYAVLQDFAGFEIGEEVASQIMNDADDSELDHEALFSKYEVTFGGVDLAQLLKVINVRIAALLDRDHLIGHAYLFGIYTASEPLEALITSFRTNIIPLLQEYFFNDYGKIGLILGNDFVAQSNVTGTRFASFAGAENMPDSNADEFFYELTDWRGWTIDHFKHIYVGTNA